VLWLPLLLATLAQASGTLTVSAAVSLTEVLEDVARAYRTAAGGSVAFNVAGSNVLSRQIVNGAPVDVFVSADEAQMDVVERAGLIVPGSRAPVAGNRLAVVISAGAPALTTLEELAGTRIRRIAIGDPAAVPAGVYARAYLSRVGLWPRLAGKIVPTANVRAALSAVQNGTTDAAIVYATDAALLEGLRTVVVVSGPDSPRIVYPAAVVRTTRKAEAAAGFIEFLRGPAAQRIFQRHGFLPAGVGP
jgi:molybdate transport system substrate-binding protein